MNIMRKIFLTVLLVAFASAAFAEGTPKKPSVAGFVSNGFWDNWEISAGFGTGTAFSNGGNSGSWGDRFGFEGNLSVTKWVHPVFGMRAQLQGGWFNNFDSQIGKMTWPYMFGHLDFMVNASNWIGGYRADRAWYAVPFAGFGYMASNFTDRSQRENASGSRQEFAFTAGLLSKFRLSPAFDFNIELKGLLAKSDICPAEMNGSYLAGLSATAGITYRFNQRGWERGVPGYTADDIRAFQNAVAAGNSALEAARSENADLANRLKAAEAEADAAKAAAAAAAAKAAAEERMERIAPEMVHGLERVFKRAAKVFFLRAFRTQVHLARDAVDSFLIIHGRFILAAFFAFHKSFLLSKRMVYREIFTGFRWLQRPLRRIERLRRATGRGRIFRPPPARRPNRQRAEAVPRAG